MENQNRNKRNGILKGILLVILAIVLWFLFWWLWSFYQAQQLEQGTGRRSGFNTGNLNENLGELSLDSLGNLNIGKLNNATISGGSLSPTQVNGVEMSDFLVATGTYANPAWLTSLAGSKVDGGITGSAANVTGIVEMANGGSGKDLKPKDGGIVWTDGNSMEVLDSEDGFLRNDDGELSWENAYSRIENEGADLDGRGTLNFIGAGVSCVDVDGKTECTITGSGGGGGPETDPIFVASPANGITNTNIANWNSASVHKTTEDAINGLVRVNGAGVYSAATGAQIVAAIGATAVTNATNATSVPWTGVSGRPIALSAFTNDLGNYGGFVTGTPWTGMGYLTQAYATIEDEGAPLIQRSTINFTGPNIICTDAGSKTLCTIAPPSNVVTVGPVSATADSSANPSIWVNDAGGGNLLQLQSGGIDQFVVNNAGDVIITGTYNGTTLTGGSLTSTQVNGVTTANILVSTGSYSDPAWLTSLAASKISGILPLANGGTAKALTAVANGIVYTDADSMEILSPSAGTLTYNGSALVWNNTLVSNPMTTLGDIIYGGTGGLPTRLGGTAGFLKSTGAAAPAWSTLTDADIPDNITINGTGNISWSSINMTGSSLADLATRDHGSLTGLGDDDHPQYQLRAEKDQADGYAGLDSNSLVDDAQVHDLTYIRESEIARFCSGLSTGGDISISGGGTSIDIVAGTGFINNHSGIAGTYKQVTWGILAGVAPVGDGTNYVAINSDGTLDIALAKQPMANHVYLGHFYAQGGNVIEVFNVPEWTQHFFGRVNEWMAHAVGPLVAEGLTVTEKANPNELELDIAAGEFYARLGEYPTSATSTFTKMYNSADNGWGVSGSDTNHVNVTQWNDMTQNQASALTTMTAGYWKKDLLLVVPSGNVYYIFGQAEYATEDEAKLAPLPSVPAAISEDTAKIATIILQEGDTTIGNRIVDIRPNMERIFGYGTSGGGTSVSHGALIGLAADDHTQYLLLNGRDGGQMLTGGVVADSLLTLRGNNTTGNTATSKNIVFKVGDNASTEALAILNNGTVDISTKLGILESTGATYRTFFQGGDQSADITYTLPTNNNTGFLKNTAGTWSWNALVLSDISVPTAGSPSAITNLNAAYDYMWSAGVISGGDITDNGDGTVDISAGEALLRTSTSETAPLKSVTFAAASNISLTDSATNYLYVGYNGGTPNVQATTILTDFNCTDKCHLYTIVREGTELFILDGRFQNIDANRKLRRKNYETNPFAHVTGGSNLANSNRYLALTAGAFYYSLEKVTHGAFDTSVAGTSNDRIFMSHYRDGSGGWTHVTGEKQIDNASYDDGDGTLGTLTDGNYGVHWVYLAVGQSPLLMTVYGRGDYATLDEAKAESLSQDLPPMVSGVGALVGRVIIQKNNTTIDLVESAFVSSFGSGAVTSHNALSGLTNDDHAQYALLAGRSGGQTLIGGSAASDDLIFRATSANAGSDSYMLFQTGNDGATEAMRILNDGTVDINSKLGILESTGATYRTFFQGGDQSADIVYTLPTTSANGLLKNTGGTFSWDNATYLTQAYSTVEDEGAPLTQRSNINFTGAGVACTDSGGKTVCTISGGAAGSLTLGPASADVDTTTNPSIWVNDTGTGNLLELEAGGVDRLVIANNGNVTGGTYNGATITGGSLTSTQVNGVTTANILVSTGSYSDPAWLTSLAASKISGILPLANGGTAKALTAVANGIVYTDADSMEILSPSTGNLRYNGSNLVWDNATYLTQAYATVEDEGTPLTQRTNLNFTGAGVTCSDSGGKTVCTIPGGSGGGLTLGPASADVDTTTNPSIWVNDTGTGNLLELEAGGTDRFVVANNGNVTGGTFNTATLSGGSLTSTAVNGVTTANILLSTGSYASPAWLTAISGGIVSGNISGYSANTLQYSYDNDVNGSSAEILMTATDGSVIFKDVAGTQFQVAMNTATAPTVDLMNIYNAGASQGTVSNNVDGLQIDFATAAVAGTRHNSGLQINVDASGATEASDLIDGIDIAGITNPTGLATAIDIGTGWDTGLSIGNATPTRTLDVTGTMGGNNVTSAQSLTSSSTVTVSTKASSYYLSNNQGTTNASVTTTFDITGLPDTDGTFAYVFLKAQKGITAGAQTQSIILQVNGTAVPGGTVATSNVTVATSATKTFTLVRMNDGTTSAWRLVGASGNGSGASGTGTVIKSKTADESVTSSAVLQDDDELNFAVGANETWSAFFSVEGTAATAQPDIKFTITAPSGAVCDISYSLLNSPSSGAGANLACGTAAVNIAIGAGENIILFVTLNVTNGSTPGNVQFQWAQNTSNATATTVLLGSYLHAFLSVGADVAETYYTRDTEMNAGDVVAIDGLLRSGVKKSAAAYDRNAIGVITTMPGLVLGEGGKPEGSRAVFVALAGRVPVKVSGENGDMRAGDYLTSSAVSGTAMKATKAGPVIGQALEDVSFESGEIKTVLTYIKNGQFNGERLLDENGIESTGADLLAQLLDNKTANDGASVLTTDRVAAGLEVVTPNLVADTITARSIKAESIEGLEFIQTGLDSNAADIAASGAAVTDLGLEIRNLKNRLALHLDENILKQLEISGALTVSGPATFMGATVFEKIATFFDKVLFKKDVEFAGRPTFNSDTAGFAVVKEGAQTVRIEFKDEYANVPVAGANVALQKIADQDVRQATEELMLNSGIQYIITDLTAKGFEIKLSRPAEYDMPFTWQAIAVKDAQTFESKSEAEAPDNQAEESDSSDSEIIETAQSAGSDTTVAVQNGSDTAVETPIE